jgi:hypothetical protein
MYWFYRRNGLRIPIKSSDGQRLKKGDLGFMEAYERIHAGFEAKRAGRRARSGDSVRSYRAGSIAHGVAEYRESDEFNQLRTNTKRGYGVHLKWLEEKHSHRLFADMEREAVLLMRKERSKASDGRPTRATANRFVAALSVLLTFVEDRPKTFGLPKGWENPLRRSIKPLKEGEGHWPWEDDEIERFQNTWKDDTFERVFFEHLRNTGQRGIDARLMTRRKYRNGGLYVAQTKTGEEVWIPVLDEYKPILDNWLARPPAR